MTYDPDRDLRTPDDMNPNYRPDEREKSRGIGLLLGLLALMVVGGLIYYATRGDNTTASNERPAATQPSTTGAAPGTATPGSGAAGTNPPAGGSTPAR